MKKALVLVLALAIPSLLWFLHSRREARRAEEQRDAVYRTKLQSFEHDLRLGMSRSDVKGYLDAKRIPYIQMNSDLAVKIGEDTSRQWYCNRWYVYVDFRFNLLKGQTEPSSLDNLDHISIQKIGSCL